MVLTALQLSFQNCAPAPNADTELLSNDVDDGQARIVDDWQENKLNFVQPVVEVSVEDENIEIFGFCDRKAVGQDYDWEVIDPDSDDSLLIDGASQCEGGGFRLLVENLKSLQCGRPYKVQVYGENNQQDEMVLVRSCGM